MAEEIQEKGIHLTKQDRLAVFNRHQYLQGSWNYERMQNGGWCYSMIPAIKKLYPNRDDQIAALKRHLEFYNTHPYVSAPVIGVTLALEEGRANGEPIDDVTIQGVKVGMMGPLAGVGDPVFWYTVRPLLGALGASLALGGSPLGPILFFVLWNVIRLAFLWYTQEAGYRAGADISKDLSGGKLGKITEGASILGMFVIGALVERWVTISFKPVVSTIQQQAGPPAEPRLADPRPRRRGPHAVRVQAAEEERLADRHHPRPLWRGYPRPPHRAALGFSPRISGRCANENGAHCGPHPATLVGCGPV